MKIYFVKTENEFIVEEHDSKSDDCNKEVFRAKKLLTGLISYRRELISSMLSIVKKGTVMSSNISIYYFYEKKIF